jgi:alpha-beta hydrolase superfamily lysophospholipase
MSGKQVGLQIHRWPVQSARAQVLLLHGYAEHALRYTHVIRRWNDAGLAVVAVDLRGHGRSVGQRGRVDRFEDYHRDLEVGVEALVDPRELPAFLFGHSMGALLALHWSLVAEARRSPFHGLALSSPYLGLSLEVPPLKRWIGQILSNRWPSVSLPSGLSGRDVARDPNLAAEYDRDPLVFPRANVRWFTEAHRAIQDVFAGASRIHDPMLLLYGGDDRVASADATDRFAAACGSSDLTAERLPGTYHEILNEPEPIRSELADRFSRWMLDRA